MVGTFAALPGSAQPFQNNWINYNQKFLKFPVTEDGIYRISYSTLEQALGTGVVDLDTLDSRRFQLFALQYMGV